MAAMGSGGRLLALAIVAWSVSLGCGRGESAPDLIVIDADVHTADAAGPRAQAFAVKDGRIVAIGSSYQIQNLADGETLVRSAGGHSVLPGFIDGHVHLGSGADLVRGVNLYGIASKQEWLARVAARVAALEPGEWLVGGRWDHTLEGPAELPTRFDLDGVAPEHPVALADVDGHALWVNSRALELAGIDAETADPPGGRIVRDARTGEATGVLLEAGDLVTRHVPEPSAEQRRSWRRDTLRFANRVGITSVHDFAPVDTLDDYLALLEADELTVRVWFGAYISPGDAAALAERRTALANRVAQVRPRLAHGPSLELGMVKMMIDGVLSSRTAALLEPYSDAPLELGLPRSSAGELESAVTEANAAGFPVAIHAIGDLGVRMCLDAFARSLERNGPPPLPNRIEHNEVVDPVDAPRYAELGVIASMNPHHCISGIDKYNDERLGERRATWSFPWGRLRDAGATLLLGSDWATAPLDPLVQLDAAVRREKPAGSPAGGWHAENRLTWEEALRGYTLAGAEAAGWGREVGSLEVGKWADFVILDGRLPDPIDRSLLDRGVEETFVGGESVTGRRTVDGRWPADVESGNARSAP